MKFASVLSALSLLTLSSASVSLTRVTWNGIYDNPNQTFTVIACAEWAAANNYTTFKDVPSFPYIGGAYVVSGYNSPGCGTRYSILDQQTNVTVEVTVVDAALQGFVVSLEALNKLTNDNAQDLGSIQAVVTKI